MKLFVAVPAYDRAVHVETVRSLLNEQALAQGAGLDFQVSFVPGCSLVTMARNQAVGNFLESDADRLVFVDADVSWQVGALVQLATHKVDFVGGAYRLKQALEAYPVGWLPKPELWAVDGLLKVETLPGGFLCLSRDVFARLRKFMPEREYSHYDFTGHAYFDAPFRDGRLYGEDSAFCRYWRETGGEVWLDPELALTHHDHGQAFPGHIGNWLKSGILEAA